MPSSKGPSTQIIQEIEGNKKMNMNDKFDSPLFTPSTKADVGGKDVNITLLLRAFFFNIVGLLNLI